MKVLINLVSTLLFSASSAKFSHLQALFSHDLCRQQDLEVSITLHYLRPEIFSSHFMLYFILTLTELLGIDDYEQNFHIRSWVVQLTCSMQQCFGLFSFSKRYVFPRNIVSSSWQFIHTISLLFAETILVGILWKIVSKFLELCPFYLLIPRALRRNGHIPTKSWCEYFASIQHSL